MKKKVWIINIFFVLVMFWIIFPVIKVEASNGQARALIITRGDYPNGIKDLSPGPENDGKNMQRVLEQAYGDELVFKQTLVRDGVTTISGVQSAIKNAFRNSKEEDINYFFYSGHGNSGTLVLGYEYMNASQLAEAFNDIKGTNILVIDCCYSGGLISRQKNLDEESFVDDFYSEFVHTIESKNTPTTYSALTNPKFRLMVSAAKEEVSWQNAFGAEYIQLGYFTSALAYGSGINPMQVLKDEYDTHESYADFNRDGTITMMEMNQYIENTSNYSMSHVRTYPQSGNCDFLPVPKESIPSLTFEKIQMNQKMSVDIFAHSLNDTSVSYDLYWGSEDILYLMFHQYIMKDDSKKFNLVLEQCFKDKRLEQIIKSEKIIIQDGINSIELSQLKEGNYYLIVHKGDNSWLLPFSVCLETKDFDIKIEGEAYLYNQFQIDNGNELEICADFGSTTNSDIAKPYLTCDIQDDSGMIVRNLGKKELMQVIATSQDKNGFLLYGVCYRTFYWDGKDESGQYVSNGNYTIRIKSEGETVQVKEKTIQVVRCFGQIDVSKISLLNDGSDKIKLTYTLYDTLNEAVLLLIDGEGKVKKSWILKNTSYTVEWDGLGECKEKLMEGEYQIVIKVKNDLQYTGKIISLMEPPMITELSLFENDNEIEIAYSVNYDGRVTIKVENIKEKPETVRTLVSSYSIKKGKQVLSWDKKKENNCYAETGKYRIAISFIPVNGLQEIETTSENLIVNRKEFIIKVEQLEDKILDLNQNQSIVLASYTMNYSTRVSAYLYNLDGEMVARPIYRKVIADGSHTIEWDKTCLNGMELKEGKYIFRLQVLNPITNSWDIIVKEHLIEVSDGKKTEVHIHDYQKNEKLASINKDGSIIEKCKTCGYVKNDKIIPYIKDIKISKTSYVYNGKARKPSVIIKDRKGNKISKYTVKYSSGCKNVGRYTVTIKFIGNYTGTVKKSFSILPQTTSISRIIAKSKSLIIKWKKQSVQTTGYQIQYALSNKFANAKTVTIKKSSQTSKTIKKLKRKKTYYIRIRTYTLKKIHNQEQKIYSTWSKVKKSESK